MSIKFKVSNKKSYELLNRMKELDIREEELEEKFIKSSGSGGQKVNKTSSCVYLKHTPSGISVKFNKDRSQIMNRFFARRELCNKISYLKNKSSS